MTWIFNRIWAGPLSMLFWDQLRSSFQSWGRRSDRSWDLMGVSPSKCQVVWKTMKKTVYRLYEAFRYCKIKNEVHNLDKFGISPLYISTQHEAKVWAMSWLGAVFSIVWQTAKIPEKSWLEKQFRSHAPTSSDKVWTIWAFGRVSLWLKFCAGFFLPTEANAKSVWRRQVVAGGDGTQKAAGFEPDTLESAKDLRGGTELTKAPDSHNAFAEMGATVVNRNSRFMYKQCGR